MPVLLTPPAFVNNVATYLHDTAVNGRDANPAHGTRPRPASVLDIAARYARDVVRAARPTPHPKCEALEHEEHPITDPRWHALWFACGAKSTYEPDRRSEQARYLARLAVDFDGYTSPDDVISTITALAVSDRSMQLALSERQIASVRQDLVATRGMLEQARSDAKDEQTARLQALTDADKLRATLVETERMLEHERHVVVWLRDLTNEDGEAPAKAPARRTRVDGETGIYTTPQGRYEITWTENGAKKWEIIGDDLDEARRVREQRVADVKVAA